MGLQNSTLYSEELAPPVASNVAIHDIKPAVKALSGQHQGSRILRWLRHDDLLLPTAHEESDAIDDLQALAAIQRQHLEQFAESGVRVPSYTSFIAKAPNSGVPALYNLVEHLNLAQKSHFSPQQLRFIGQALISYYEWVSLTEEPVFLNDICGLRQFGQDTRGGLWLVDIEPHFLQAGDDPSWSNPVVLSHFGHTVDRAYAIRDGIYPESR